jgi:hypothetical protein
MRYPPLILVTTILGAVASSLAMAEDMVLPSGVLPLPGPAITTQPPSFPPLPPPGPRRFDDLDVSSSPSPAPIDPERARYVGSNYVLSPQVDAHGTDPEIQFAIAKALTDADFLPPARSDYFGPCRRSYLAVIGWSGQIESIQSTPGGSLVRLQVRPKIVHSCVFDHAFTRPYTEFYLFGEELGFRFLRGEGPKGGGHPSIIGL